MCLWQGPGWIPAIGKMGHGQKKDSENLIIGAASAKMAECGSRISRMDSLRSPAENPVKKTTLNGMPSAEETKARPKDPFGEVYL